MPVVVLVLVLCFTLIDVNKDVLLRFVVCSFILLAGLAIFLWGIDLAMNPIGEYMSKETATSKNPVKIAILSFLLGFLVTVAEPDLLVLGAQIHSASGGSMSGSLVVYVVSVGVGIMISLGVFRLLRDRPLNRFMAIAYGLAFILALFVSEEFLAISFDSSGATTGALTTPFVLSLSLGLSKAKGGKNVEANSFGLVGIMSTGPILGLMLTSIISGQKNIQDNGGGFHIEEGVFQPIIDTIPTVAFESIVALLPITILFFGYNYSKFKLPKYELARIIKGLIFILTGLILFLAAVHAGFLDMGWIIGVELALLNNWILIGTGFLLGMIVVLVEPAVHVLGSQIEEVTGGHIPVKIIKMTLSIGVAMAIALSMVRILVPEIKLWFLLLPGFALAALLSFKVDPIFVGVAYDAGGVASGPMTATFVLAFAQGAAAMTDSANVMIDGFGVIAMVAMAPVFSIMVMGLAFKRKIIVTSEEEEEVRFNKVSLENDIEMQRCCLIVSVNRGFSENVAKIAESMGVAGVTIIHGRGTSEHRKIMLPIIHFELQTEKEVVLLVSSSTTAVKTATALIDNDLLAGQGEIAIFVSAVVPDDYEG
ncbi:MAG TPA: DUF1538 domain-containing protein [Anaerovoracaceae bacterium]|nr:DUF1538 domain-containing protein [Anaerovoracaceae bacterium]